MGTIMRGKRCCARSAAWSYLTNPRRRVILDLVSGLRPRSIRLDATLRPTHDETRTNLIRTPGSGGRDRHPRTPAGRLGGARGGCPHDARERHGHADTLQPAGRIACSDHHGDPKAVWHRASSWKDCRGLRKQSLAFAISVYGP